MATLATPRNIIAMVTWRPGILPRSIAFPAPAATLDACPALPQAGRDTDPWKGWKVAVMAIGLACMAIEAVLTVAYMVLANRLAPINVEGIDR